MVIILLFVLALSSVADAQEIIVTEGVGSITDATSCIELLPSHKFSGSCCSANNMADGGCELTVANGYCLASGPIWFLNITSTDSDSICPIGDFNPLEGFSPASPATGAPSRRPTVGATGAPTMVLPSTVPSELPSVMASVMPSVFPTHRSNDVADSKSPTVVPSVEHSAPPATSTTVSPSDVPVVTPSLCDSRSPSLAPMSDVPPSSPSVKCTQDNECPGEFCGVDGNCYDFSCGNFYRWYPLVEYDPVYSLPLECQDGTTQIHLTNFGCAGAVGRRIPASLGVGRTPNQLCTGSTVIDTDEEQRIITFECFGFRNDTDFTDFENRVVESDIECSDQTSPGLPAYFYSGGFTYSQLIEGSLQSSTNILGGPGPTDIFVRERALVSSFVVITTENITVSPTVVPGSPEPTRAPSPASCADICDISFHSAMILILILYLQ